MKEKSQNIKLGLFVVIVFALFLSAIYYIGNSDGIFKSTFTIHCIFKDVKGLQVGNNVRYSGINIGSVKAIDMKASNLISVEMGIEESVKLYMQKNALAIIETNGLVGNMIVSIKPSTTQSPLIDHNDYIISGTTTSINEVFESVDSTLMNVNIIARDLVEITKELTNTSSILGILINDNAMGETLKTSLTSINKTTQSLHQTTSLLSASIKGIQDGEGLAGYLLTDTTLEYKVNKMMSSLDHTLNVSTSDAIVELNKASHDVTSATNKINQMLDQTMSGSNTMNSLLYDSIMTKDLKSTISNLNDGSQKLNNSMEDIQKTWFYRKFINQKKNDEENH